MSSGRPSGSMKDRSIGAVNQRCRVFLLMGRTSASKDVELLVLRHEVAAGQRPQPDSGTLRARTTADAVVGGVIGPLDAPEALLLGLPDDTGRLRVAGRTRPLALPARRELGTLLVPPQRSHPWPERIPASRFGQLPGDLVDYTPTEPLLVVEVDTDTCFDQERWRHPTAFKRVRAELDPVDLLPPGSDDE
jgi:hypothetical protein